MSISVQAWINILWHRVLRVSKAWTEGVVIRWCLAGSVGWTEVLCTLGLLVIYVIYVLPMSRNFGEIRRWARVKSLVKQEKSYKCIHVFSVGHTPGTWNADWGPEGPIWPSLVPDSLRLRRRKIPKRSLVSTTDSPEWRHGAAVFFGETSPVFLCFRKVFETPP